MAQANPESDSISKEKKLSEIYLNGWDLFDELEDSPLPFNSTEFQNKVKTAMRHFEEATVIVNEVRMFSANEMISEVSTDSMPFMLLPYFLGKLTTKMQNASSVETVELGNVYFRDHLQRCEEYELCSAPKPKVEKDDKEDTAQTKSEQRELMEAAYNRNAKIANYRKMKELEEYMKSMRTAVKNKTVDDEVRRKFFLKYLEKSIIDSKQELESLDLMKQMAIMRQQRLTAGEAQAAEESQSQSVNSAASPMVHSHGHGHSHHHHGQQKPKPKPLQPFIITRNATQKAVFGMGYPSLPILTVDEFYQQRVDEGIFPDEEKVAKMNQAQAIAAARDPNEKEDEEKAFEEQQAENDDDEYLARMRARDEYKDVVRRGDGNRHNRS